MLDRMKHIGLTLVAATVFATTAQAQIQCGNTAAANATCFVNGSVTGTMSKIVVLTLTPTNFALTMPTDADFTAAGNVLKVDVAAQTANVRANDVWTLTVQGAVWTGTGNTAAKATSDLEWNVNAGGYTAMTTSAANVVAAHARTSGFDAVIGYRTAWDLGNDSPGTYAMALVFTITAP